MSIPLEVGTWNVVMAPPKTPTAIVNRLNAAFNEVLSRPEVVARLSKSGISPSLRLDRLQARARGYRARSVKWRKAVELAGVQPQ